MGYRGLRRKAFTTGLTLITLILISSVLCVGAIVHLSSIKPFYSTMYEGAKAYFYGVKMEDKIYHRYGWDDASLHVFDTDLAFDPDKPKLGACNLKGEQTSIFLPKQSKLDEVKWIPEEWKEHEFTWKEPINTYIWEAGDVKYQLDEWECVWLVTIEADWDTYNEHPYLYRNTEIWFEIDLTPIWYFENPKPDETHFAIAKIEVIAVKTESLCPNRISVIPECSGTVRPIYFNPFGTNEIKYETYMEWYENKMKVNKNYFDRTVYTNIKLVNFGVRQNWLFQPHADAVTFFFRVIVFVIGEWKVRDVTYVPGDYGYTSTYYGGWNPWQWLRGVIGNPFNSIMMIMSMILLAVIIYAGAVVFSGVSRIVSSRSSEKRIIRLGKSIIQKPEFI